jgi:hypothetical protein
MVAFYQMVMFIRLKFLHPCCIFLYHECIYRNPSAMSSGILNVYPMEHTHSILADKLI